MQSDAYRIARWLNRASHYRLCADASPTPGGRLAYQALADCAQDIAARLEETDMTPSARGSGRRSANERRRGPLLDA
jgi:hypothetical protein